MFPFFIIGCCVSSVFYSTMHGTMKIERESKFSVTLIKEFCVVFFLHNLTYPVNPPRFSVSVCVRIEELWRRHIHSVKRKASLIVYVGSRTGCTRLENSWILKMFFKAFKVLDILLHSWSFKVLVHFDLGTFSNLQNALANTSLKGQNKIGIEEMKVCRTDKRIFIKIAALIWKRCVKKGPWNSKPVMWKVLDFYGKKCTSPVLHLWAFISPQRYPIACYRK